MRVLECVGEDVYRTAVNCDYFGFNYFVIAITTTATFTLDFDVD